MSCEEILEDSDPLAAFSKELLNFHSHYCNNQHDSLWCKFHAATNKDGNPYTTKSPLLTTIVGGKEINSLAMVLQCQTMQTLNSIVVTLPAAVIYS